MCDQATAKKVQAFVNAAKETKRLLDNGASRSEIGQRVSTDGRKKFWDHWLE
jgi:hypothetical protein